MGLRKSDFRAGKAVETLECGQAMKRMDLYAKLVVNIERQREKDSSTKDPKAFSKGWDACFNEEAAKLIVENLKTLGKDDFLLPMVPDTYFVKWREDGMEEVTLKDLRRASLYHLGHHTEFQNAAILLLKYARHKNMDTTMIYLRRPKEELEAFKELDLEA